MQKSALAMHLLKTGQHRTGLGFKRGIPRVWQQQVQKLFWLAVTEQIAWLTRGTLRVSLSSRPTKVPLVECSWCLVSPAGFRKMGALECLYGLALVFQCRCRDERTAEKLTAWSAEIFQCGLEKLSRTAKKKRRRKILVKSLAKESLRCEEIVAPMENFMQKPNKQKLICTFFLEGLFMCLSACFIPIPAQ